MAGLKLQAVTKSWDGKTQVIQPLTLDVADGEFIVMVGPSGCGKFTDVNLGTAVAGIKGMIATGEGTTQWNQVMAAMLLTLIPPVVIVLAMQRAFVRGLVDSEK